MLSCIYRTPGSCPNIFNEKMMEMYGKINDRKMVFVCGDFNIDLLDPNENKTNRDFMDIMYSLCLIPTIIQPTRITRDSAT